MYIVSEITKKKYDSVEECLADEKRAQEQKERKEELLAEAFDAIKAYLEADGKLTDVVKLFGNYKLVDREFGYPLWKWFE